MKTELSEKFRYLGFIMTCAMVLYHCPIVENLPAVGALDHFAKVSIDTVIRGSVNLIMAYFFSVTGFLLFRNFRMKDYPEKIKKRVFSLLIPYILWQLIFAVIDTVFKFEPVGFAEFLQRSFLLQRWPVDAALWYVYAVFLLALLSPVVLLIIRKKSIGWIAILLVLAISSARLKIEIPVFKTILHYGYVENILVFLPAYLMGAFYGYHFKDASSGCLSYLLSALLLAVLTEGIIEGFALNTAVLIVPLALIYLLPPVPFLENRKIYRLSFLMYALHQPLMWKLQAPVFNLYSGTIYKLIPFATAASIITRLVFLAVVIGLAALIHFIFSKLSPRFLAMLSGGRA